MQAREVQAERFTGLDRDLLAVAEDGMVTTTAERGAFGRFRRALLIGRLERLERFGLAAKDGVQRWRLSEELEPTLRRLGERGDIIRTMQRALGADREPGRFAIFDPGGAQAPVLGRVAATGAADETKGTRYVVVDATDARQYYVEIGRPEAVAIPPVGAIVSLESARGAPKPADRIIDAIARAHDGRYADDLHLAHDPSASAEFRAAHVRRLEALRRAGIVTREAEGGWRVPEDYLGRTSEFEARRVGTRLQVLSWLPLEQLAERRSATWLDQEIEAGRSGDPNAIAFGGELRDALARRRAWLLAQGFALEKAGGLTPDRAALSRLAVAEVTSAGARLSEKLGKAHTPAIEGVRVEGTYTRAVNLASGRFAVLERSKDFTLVPWREVIEPRRGQAVIGLVRGETVQWELGRSRGRDIS